MDPILSVIVVLIFLFIVYTVTKSSGKKTSAMTNRQQINIIDDGYNTLVNKELCAKNPEFCTEDDTPVARGLNEIEQTTQSRGYIPYANQPDHVANLWKCDQSHCENLSKDRDEMQDYIADVYIPSRAKVVNLHIKDASNMHITSRFASTSSS